MSAIFDAFASAVLTLSGAVAAIIASCMASQANRRRDRDRLSTEFVTIYMKDIMSSYATGVAGLSCEPDTPEHFKAQEVGNWFEAFAALINLEHASSKVVESTGLKCEMKKFWTEAADAYRKGKGSINPYVDWKNLKDYVE